MVWCHYCMDERFYALIKEIKEDISHKKKLLKQKFQSKAFQKELRKHLKVEIATLESVLNMAKNSIDLATLSKKELEKLSRKEKLFGL